ncbi:MAG: hypothetical protein U0841_23825 [Chloroflexia bacterium]
MLIDRGQRLKRMVPVWEDCGKPEELLQTNCHSLSQLAAKRRDLGPAVCR